MAACSKGKAKSTLYGQTPKQEVLKPCQDIPKSPISSPRKSVEGFLFLMRNADFYRLICLHQPLQLQPGSCGFMIVSWFTTALVCRTFFGNPPPQLNFGR
jgi:hypothetical protein